MSGGWLKMHQDGQQRKWDRQKRDSRVEALKETEKWVADAEAEVARLRRENPDSIELIMAESHARAVQRSLDVSRVML